MAAARKVTLRAEEPYERAGRRVVAARTKDVFAKRRGVLDLADVERVHAMRVATRRLRAALEVFEPCFKPERHRKALREVTRLADALGKRRDLDVHIEALEGLLTSVVEPERSAVKQLIGELRGDQHAANRELARALKRARRKQLRRRLRRLTA
jgi:CHAD domain-containing protein